MTLWAKVDVDMPTDGKLLGQPVVTRHLWTCLICLAKRQDAAGAVSGYDCSLLAGAFNLPRKAVAEALTHYQAVRMVELDPDGTIRLINFAKRQAHTDSPEAQAQRSKRYYDNHREEILEHKRSSHSSRVRKKGFLTASSQPSPHAEVEQSREEQIKAKATDLPTPAAPAPTRATWNSYSDAYEQRYGVRPADSASERGKLIQFLRKVPQEEAPLIAAFFLTHNDALYIRAKHPIDLLLRDAQKLRTEWLNGRQVTGSEARQQEQTHANVSGWESLRRVKDGVVR